MFAVDATTPACCTRTAGTNHPAGPSKKGCGPLGVVDKDSLQDGSASATRAGFSVVADEVRSLAQRAAEAARNTAEIIEKTDMDVGAGVNLVSLAHGAFQEVSVSIASGSQLVSQIATSSEAQARGITHIGEAVSRIESVTQNNVANAQETAAAASAVTTQVQTTREHLSELAAIVGAQRT